MPFARNAFVARLGRHRRRGRGSRLRWCDLRATI